MSLVLDASVALAWCFNDEETATSTKLLERVTAPGPFVPSLWRLEVANALQIGVRRGRIDVDFRDASLADLALLEIAIDDDTDTHAWGATLQLAARLALTVYDATYLELAQRRGLPLATLDERLRVMARGLGVPLL